MVHNLFRSQFRSPPPPIHCLLDPEDEVSERISDYTASHPRRLAQFLSRTMAPIMVKFLGYVPITTKQATNSVTTDTL
jgi:hypothetical protein